MRTKLLFLALAAAMAIGCAHKIKVVTTPPGALVEVDGKKVGTAPVVFEESILPGSHRVVATLDGYYPASVEVERTEVNWWWVAGGLAGCVLCFPAGCAGGAVAANAFALSTASCGVCLGGSTGPCTAILAAPSIFTVPAMSCGSLVGAAPAGLLALSETEYESYFEGAKFVHFLLGPATVALAIPLYRQCSALKRHPFALAVSLITGSLTAVLSAVFIAKLGGVGSQALVSIAPKSVTTPVAMGISEQLGGLPSLTAVVVILTGILGAATGPWLLDKLRITNPMARGLAMGTAAHGIGTGRAIYMGDVAAAFSGLAMGLNGLATTILLPALWGWITK